MKASQKQINLIKSLYRELGQTPEEDIENMTSQEASETIKELLELKQKREPKDDGKYWY